MKRMIWSILLTITALSAADDPWDKVRELKSGTELRIYKKGAKQPALAKLDEAKEGSLVVVLKNEQVSIPKEEIDRLDQRPSGGSRVTRQSTTKTNAMGNPSPDQQHTGSPGPTSSSSTSFSLGSKPDFENVYRRPPVALKK
jgi:hypothetical protein